MNELKEIYFKDFIKLKRGYDLPNDKIIDGKYPIVASTAVKAFHKEYKVLPPCVVTGRSGSLGEVQFVDTPCWVLNTALYVKNFNENNPKYVYYFLKMMRLEIFNSGAGVPTLNQNHLHHLKIQIHSKEQQQQIAQILTAYDDLIETNNQRIATLDQLVQQIYKEWFVRLRFPNWENTPLHHGIPEGWEVKSIGEICIKVTDGSHFSPAFVPEGKPMASVKDMQSYGFSLDKIKIISVQDFEKLQLSDCL